jgi:hypothetical protein
MRNSKEHNRNVVLGYIGILLAEKKRRGRGEK